MSNAYVQVIPDSTGKKIQVFENTLDNTNAVEAQAVVPVNSLGVESGSLAAPLKVKNLKLEELLWLILAELRMANYYAKELNPKILLDSTEQAGEYSTYMTDANG